MSRQQLDCEKSCQQAGRVWMTIVRHGLSQALYVGEGAPGAKVKISFLAERPEGIVANLVIITCVRGKLPLPPVSN